ncbi:MAG TPA: polymer-forming cytoskeletal protein [Paludibacteraceae bacterium]|jgi:cytoskeletal protein CcmA (bactofilin family)|nr:polymer-forming cytoskeletal protein [Paludibacteraceae bacterium]
MAKEVAQNSGIIYNSLTNGSKIVGTITAENDFRIDGEVEGEIFCNGKVVIGQKGYLKGSISCNNAEIIGTVEGEISVQDTLSLRQTAKVTGNVKIKVLIIEPGAIFNGQCCMNETDSIQESE